MARVAVVGVGAIGGVCAANLIAGGHDVICCVRTPFRELTLESAGSVQTVPVRIETTPSSLPPVDWALLATKAHQTEGAIEWLTGAHRIAVLQNGVEHVERLARWIEPARLVPVVIACPASAGPPGHVVQRARAQMTVADTRDARDFAALFANTSIDAECTTDWPTAAWRKLCSNVTGGAIAALAGVPLCDVRHPRLREVAYALAHECAEVGRAEGADVPATFADMVAEGALSAKPGGLQSTLTDRIHRRPLEADARNGAVVRIGARHGIRTPVNAIATELMSHAHEDPTRDLLPELVERALRS